MKRSLTFKGINYYITDETIIAARQYFVDSILKLKSKEDPRIKKYIERTLAGLCDDSIAFDYRCLVIQSGDKIDVSFKEYFGITRGLNHDSASSTT